MRTIFRQLVASMKVVFSVGLFREFVAVVEGKSFPDIPEKAACAGDTLGG